MPITVVDVANHLRQSVDWNKFYSVVDTIGSTLNGAKDRFEKSDLFEGALEAYSNNKEIKYVNENGVDHRLTGLNNTNLEMKFSSKAFYGLTKKGLKELGKPITVKLVNSLGSNSHTQLPAGYAEFLLVADNNGARVIATKDLTPYLNFAGDGISADKVPVNLFVKIVGPEDLSNRVVLDTFNYKEAKRQFQLDFLGRF